MQDTAENVQNGTMTDATTVEIPLIVGERYILLVGDEASNFNGASVVPKLNNGAGSVSAIPTPGSSDSAASPQTFSGNGMIEFAAGLPQLDLVPTAAVTSVVWTLTRVAQLEQVGKFPR